MEKTNNARKHTIVCGIWYRGVRAISEKWTWEGASRFKEPVDQCNWARWHLRRVYLDENRVTCMVFVSVKSNGDQFWRYLDMVEHDVIG